MLLFYNISAALSIVKIATINYEIGNAYFAENSMAMDDPATPNELRGMAFMSRAPFAWRSPASTWSTVDELASLVPADLWNPERLLPRCGEIGADRVRGKVLAEYLLCCVSVLESLPVVVSVDEKPLDVASVWRLISQG